MRRMTAVLLAFVCLTAAAAVLSGPLATRAGTMSGTGEGGSTAETVVTAQVKEEEPQPDEPEEDSVQPGENSGENEHAGQTEAEQNNVFQNVMTGDAESVFTILLLLAGSGIVLLANRIGRLSRYSD